MQPFLTRDHKTMLFHIVCTELQMACRLAAEILQLCNLFYTTWNEHGLHLKRYTNVLVLKGLHQQMNCFVLNLRTLTVNLAENYPLFRNYDVFILPVDLLTAVFQALHVMDQYIDTSIYESGQ